MAVETMIYPRSLEQRFDALERANHVRTTRARLKVDLKAGRRDLADLVEDPPEWLETAKIVDIMLALPKTGRWRVGLALKALENMSPSKTFGGLSVRQRRELVALLREGPLFAVTRAHLSPGSRSLR
jgi:hypothetical protein